MALFVLYSFDRFDALSLIADNAIHGAWVVGPADADWQSVDLAVQPVQLRVNGEVIETGSGAAVLGHPLNALAWLANTLSAQGRTLKQGEYVTTGVCTNIYFAEAGDAVQAGFGALGTAEVTFS